MAVIKKLNSKNRQNNNKAKDGKSKANVKSGKEKRNAKDKNIYHKENIVIFIYIIAYTKVTQYILVYNI